MSLIEHAKKELELAGWYKEDSMYAGMIPESVLELIEVFSKQGHSGGSAPIVANLFRNLALYKNLGPVTGEDAEWIDVSETFGGTEQFQNSRCSAIFKQGKDGRAYYLDAIVWQGPEEFDSFSGKVNNVTSRQYVKSFPFTPKTFRIDVLREEWNDAKHNNGEWDRVECGPGPMAYRIKDREQLLSVFEYYDRYETN